MLNVNPINMYALIYKLVNTRKVYMQLFLIRQIHEIIFVESVQVGCNKRKWTVGLIYIPRDDKLNNSKVVYRKLFLLNHQFLYREY